MVQDSAKSSYLSSVDKVVTPLSISQYAKLIPKLRACLPWASEVYALNLILAQAERRYIIWLKLLSNLDYETHKHISPPLDVAFMWIVHMSDNEGYIRDIVRFGGEPMLKWKLDLQKLNDALDLGDTFVDSVSQSMWESPTNEAYKFRFTPDMPFPMSCPYCQNEIEVSGNKYISARLNDDTNSDISCSKCRNHFSKDLYSALMFLTDIKNDKQLKGLQFNADRELSVQLDLSIQSILNSTQYESTVRTQVLETKPSRKWSYWNVALVHLKLKLRESGVPERIGLYAIYKLINSYRGIMTDLSVDLVERGMAFLDFVNVVTETGDAIEKFGYANTLERYLQFLILQESLCSTFKAEVKKSNALDYQKKLPKLMPTIDILLAYQVHTLSPIIYNAYCRSHFDSRFLRFQYFSEPTDAFIESYKYTSQLWKERYNTPYDPLANAKISKSAVTKNKARSVHKTGTRAFKTGMGALGVALMTIVAPEMAIGISNANKQEEYSWNLKQLLEFDL
ncbi:hypothetical protein BKA69DRAFT_1043722 [Paraphysoderma sedebokerense]|nr:hypothetical protein BKA69DRAFT_1043722 [Paraphysoderma sedebokerense]